jgi:pyrimidine-nucleoside phosphorylase
MDPTGLRRAIARKRDGEALEGEIWEAIVRAYLTGTVDDAPVAALMMACVWRGMTREEIFALTRAMLESGEVVELGFDAVDKHSTGGVGDTVSLIVVPLVAACGVRVAKLSGRALGHTGGTLDKLEAIPGVTTELGIDRFREIVRTVGCAISAQSEKLVPADKKLYALRDRTGTVPSLGLITASIVSKKLASGAKWNVFDVKCGRGSFLKTEAEAFALAEAMVQLSEDFGRAAVAFVTDMEEPLGPAIGSGLEAIEARDFLRRARRDPRLEEDVLHIGAAMLELSGVSDAEHVLRKALENGSGYERFVKMIEAQGGSRAALEAMHPLPGHRIASETAGFIEGFDSVALGELGHDLVERAGPLAGIRISVRFGEAVESGQALAEVHGPADPEIARRVRAAITVGRSQRPSRAVTIGSIRSSSPLRMTSAIK